VKFDVKTLDIICMTGLLALVLGGSFVALKSIRSNSMRADQRHAAIEKSVSQLAQAEAVLSTITQVVESNQAALDTLRERLPESSTMGDFLSRLDALAQQNSINLSSVTPGETKAEELCSKTRVQFECSGSFNNLHSFLYNLETLPRLVRIDQTTITRTSPDRPSSMDVTCNVYSR
jgi:Tfp pilus assembly protein PilO